MQVDMEELEKARAAFAFSSGASTAAFSKIVEEYHGALRAAAPSLIAEIREARTRLGDITAALSDARKLIKPFADSAYNDNGEMSVTNAPSAGYEFCCNAYFVERRAARLLDPAKEPPDGK